MQGEKKRSKKVLQIQKSCMFIAIYGLEGKQKSRRNAC